MGIANQISRWWAEFKTNFQTQTHKQVERQDIDRINEAIDEDRGYARGKEKQETRKRKELEKEVKRDREKNVSQHLKNQQEQLRQKIYKDSTSLKKLIQIAQENNIELLSRDMQQKFGVLDDIWLLQNGQIALVNEESDVVMSGPSTTDIFRNPGGLRNEVMNGFIGLNANQKGQPVESIESKQVPDLIKAPNGDMTFTETHQEQFLEKIGQYKQRMSQLASKNSALEQSVVRLSEKVNELTRDMESMEALSDANKEQLERRAEEMKNVVGEYDSMQRQMARMSSNKQMSEEMTKDVLNKVEDVKAELSSRLDEDELDYKEDEIRRIATLAAEIASDAQAGQVQNQSSEQEQTEEG